VLIVSALSERFDLPIKSTHPQLSNRPSPHPFSLAHIHLVGSQIQGYQFLNFVVWLFFIFPPALLYLFIFIFRFLFLFLFLSQLINLFNGIGWLSIDWPAHWLNASLTYSLSSLLFFSLLPTVVVGFYFQMDIYPSDRLSTLHSPLAIECMAVSKRMHNAINQMQL